MKRRRILVVAMLDSIHTARWLAQFKEEDIDFLIVASKKFKYAHPNLIYLLKSQNQATFKLADFRLVPRFVGYLDFISYILMPKVLRTNIRLRRLSWILKHQEFEFVHALEIQGAGYLVDGAIRRSGTDIKFILTNWGSDIYYFEKFPEHKKSIISALQQASHYSAECSRDYSLARELGFVGIELPCIPNAGGFDLSLTQSQHPTSARKNIVAKAYGGDFGRGDLVIESLFQILSQFAQVTAFLYSVTDDLTEKIDELVRAFPGRVAYSGRRSPLSRDQMRELFLESRIYIGASRTDGISTSFLEAVVSGCYPIQTNTSCAGEWVNIGAMATLVNMDVAEITNGISAALLSDGLVDQAQAANFKIAQKYLSSEAIQPTALNFYRS